MNKTERMEYKLIRSNQEVFTRLIQRYLDHRSLRIIQRDKKVFYSETEKEHYDSWLLEDLIGYYDFLFESMIAPIDRDLLNLKVFVSPLQLQDILKGKDITEIQNLY